MGAGLVSGCGGTEPSNGGSGGKASGSGGQATGSGGASTTGNGGAASGGTPSSGGATSGGSSSGGAVNGGTTSSGGTANGGASNGGTSNGGVSAGGASSGGAGSGGSSNGGANSGGANSGGASSGGAPSGGGGSSTGGAGTGGTTASGGASSGGASSGGASSGGAASGGSGSGGTTCMTPPAASPLVGWATNGSGTTGGGNLTPVVVTTAAALTTNLSGTTARVIHVSGNITGSFAIGSNKTLIGVCGAQIKGHLGVSGSSNVIVRNLKVVGNNCADSPADCSSGADAISVNGQAHHVWFDHLDVSDGSDGNLDITQGSDFVTVSWTKFSYSSKRTDPEAGASGHRFSNLIGASDTDALDPGKLNITYHHCWWADNVDQRMPRTRRGKIHVFNNLYTSSGNSYCTNAGQDAVLLVENNVYSGVNQPFTLSGNGVMRAVGNLQTNAAGTPPNGAGFTPPYTYKADATSGLEAALRSGVGPH
ncbi:MAG: hypothetical protein QM756_46555 [Polyangiaceae bacterium]